MQALEYVREHIREYSHVTSSGLFLTGRSSANTVVNLVGVFQVSAIYNVSGIELASLAGDSDTSPPSSRVTLENIGETKTVSCFSRMFTSVAFSSKAAPSLPHYSIGCGVSLKTLGAYSF